jgi:hypothetical protein
MLGKPPSWGARTHREPASRQAQGMTAMVAAWGGRTWEFCESFGAPNWADMSISISTKTA